MLFECSPRRDVIDSGVRSDLDPNGRRPGRVCDSFASLGRPEGRKVPIIVLSVGVSSSQLLLAVYLLYSQSSLGSPDFVWVRMELQYPDCALY